MRHSLKALFEHRTDGQATSLGTSLRHTAARLRGVLHHPPASTPEDQVDTPMPASGPDVERPLPAHRAYPPGTAPGALQHRPHEDSRYFGTQNPEAPPAGNTFQERLGSIAQWDPPDEDALWAGPLPESRPVQTWEEIEPELKSDWESRHAGSGASAWDKIKTAMRHGWERTMH